MATGEHQSPAYPADSIRRLQDPAITYSESTCSLASDLVLRQPGRVAYGKEVLRSLLPVGPPDVLLPFPYQTATGAQPGRVEKQSLSSRLGTDQNHGRNRLQAVPVGRA